MQRPFVKPAMLGCLAFGLLSVACDIKAYPDKVAGIGVVVHRESVGHSISKVVPNGPAAAAGVSEGDRLVAVDGEPTEKKSLADVVKSLRGDEGTQVLLKIENKTGQTTVAITRRAMTKTGNNDYQVQ